MYRFKNPNDQGELNPSLLPYMDALQGNKLLKYFTSGNDAYHRGLKTNSRHKTGNAVDFTLTDPSQAGGLIKALQDQAAQRGDQINILNEYLSPSAHSTGGHLHLSIGGTRQKPVQLAQSGVTMNDAPQPPLPKPEAAPFEMKRLQDFYNAPDLQNLPGLLKTDDREAASPMQQGLLSAAFALMGNKPGSSFGQALSQGGMAGLLGAQQADENNLAQQQYNAQVAQQNAKLQEAAQERARQEAARMAFQNIDYSKASVKDLAMQAFALGDTETGTKLISHSGETSPYWTTISTADGVYAVNARNPNERIPLTTASGKPMLKAADDPALQGVISNAKEYGKNAPIIERTNATEGIKSNYDINTHAANAGTDVHMAEPKAFATETGKNKAELDQVDSKRTMAANDTLGLIGTGDPDDSTTQAINKLIDTATGSGVGKLASDAASFMGYSTKATEAEQQLKALGANLKLKVPRMEGPQSDKDAKLYEEAAGSIGDPSIPSAQRRAALDVVRQINRKYAHLNGGGAPNVDDLIKKYAK